MFQRGISYVAGMLLLALTAFSAALAQPAQRQPTPNDTLVSPEAHSDKHVTFRIYAPKASEVALRGDWMEGPGTVKLEKDDKGVWSTAVGPLAPDFYSYAFIVDGGGDEDSGWSTIGRAGFILDNLIAAKKARPMIVVMPNGSLPRPASLSLPLPGTPPDPAVTAALQDRFTNELMKDVVPFVEKNYRVLTGRDNRAIAGLSMGGGQTTRVITRHPDQLAYVGVWSAGVNPQNADFEQRNAAFLGSADKLNKQIKLFSISVGDKDFALAGSKNLAELLKKNGVKHELNISGGGHTWINWRRYLNELAPRLFRTAGE